MEEDADTTKCVSACIFSLGLNGFCAVTALVVGSQTTGEAQVDVAACRIV